MTLLNVKVIHSNECESVNILRRIYLLHGLCDRELAAIGSYFSSLEVKRGQSLLREGDVSDCIYFVISGAFKLSILSKQGKEQTLDIVGTGVIVNEITMLNRSPIPFSAIACTDSIVYVLQNRDLRSLFGAYHVIANNIIQTLTDNLLRVTELVEDLSFRTVRARVAKILLTTNQYSARSLVTTQSDIAAMAGTNREVVGSTLKQLFSEGTIQRRNGKIAVSNYLALRKAMDDEPLCDSV